MEEEQIIFNYEEIDFSLQNEKLIINWINKTILEEHKEIGNISYIFCNDKYLLDINKQYLNHDYFTDIITFDYTEDDIISGDIFISIDTIETNTKEFKTTFVDELHRVIIHGILHLVGYNDKTDEQQKEMTEKENYYLSIF